MLFPTHESWMWVFQLGTWLALAIEILLIFGVWLPSIRTKVLILGIAFHLTPELSMNLFVFQSLMILILATHFFSTRNTRGVGQEEC